MEQRESGETKPKSSSRRVDAQVTKFLDETFHYHEKFDARQAWECGKSKQAIEDLDFDTFVNSLNQLATSHVLRIIQENKIYMINRYPTGNIPMLEVVQEVKRLCSSAPQRMTTLKNAARTISNQQISTAVHILAALGVCKISHCGRSSCILWDDEQAQAITKVPEIVTEIYKQEQKAAHIRDQRMYLETRLSELEHVNI